MPGDRANQPATIKKMERGLIPKGSNVIMTPYLCVLSSDATRPIAAVSMNRLATDARGAAREVRDKIKEEGIEGNADAKAEDTEDADKKDKDTLLAPSQAWTNDKGKTITAAVVKVDGDTVIFQMSGGKEVRYPISKLSQESQDKINGLQKGG